MAQPDAGGDAQKYEPPTVERAGSLAEITQNAQRSGGDAPLSPSTAFGPDS